MAGKQIYEIILNPSKLAAGVVLQARRLHMSFEEGDCFQS